MLCEPSTRLINWLPWPTPFEDGLVTPEDHDAMRSADAGCSAPLIRNLVKQTQLPRLEIQMILSHVLEKPRVWLVAHDDACLTEAQLTRFVELHDRRIRGEPMAYLLGYREFMGLELRVSPAVLIPRPETECLVEAALDVLSGVSGVSTVNPMHAPRVLDLGTGSGAIAIAIAKARPDAHVVAVDISPDALGLAKNNAKRHGVSIQWLLGSWFEPLVQQALEKHSVDRQFDVVVSNPPYIAQGDVHLQTGDLRFEPTVALTDGSDGLSAYRLIIAQCGSFLRKGGALLFEHGFEQAIPVLELMQAAGFGGIKTIPDLAGHPRVTAGFYNS